MNTRRRRHARFARDDEADGREARPRRGARRTVLATIRDIPRYVRLLFGLLGDARVRMIDKALVGAAIVYIITPLDFIPDFIPFLGEVDDVFLLVLSLQRLIDGAGRRVLLDHWSGDPAAVGRINLKRVLGAASFFLPWRLRRRLRRIART